jgi:hydrogenase maturation protease
VKALVLGFGNEYRSDDGVGLAVVRRLEPHLPTWAEAVATEPHAIDLFERWKDADLVILVDAVSSGSPPGTIHRFEAQRQPVPAVFARSSTHAYSIAEMIELARVLGTMPPRLLVLGIEGDSFQHGVGLSPAVARAAAEVVQNILRILEDPSLTEESWQPSGVPKADGTSAKRPDHDGES